ncbi:MAG: zinc ribbon domain-containing protein, partial [Promethearchaeota archaeon]
YNYCGECGNPLSPDDKSSCPKCGELIESAPVLPTLNRKVKIKRRSWGNLSWILLLLGSALGLFGLTTPAASFNLDGLYSWDMWMFGYNVMFDWEVGTDIFWTRNLELLGISVGATIFVILGNILAIVGSISILRKKNYGPILAMISPIILCGTAIFFLIAYELYFQFYLGESFWSLLSPGFAVYGQFLVALIMLPGFLIARKALKYVLPKKRDEHEVKVYQMLKKLIESEDVSDSRKEELKNKLEIISLRFMGMDILYRKLEYLASEKQDFGFSNEDEYHTALGYFQQVVDLTADQIINFSKIDLELAAKIILESDLIKAIEYFKDIKLHTSRLMSELLIKSSYARFSNKVGPQRSTSPKITTTLTGSDNVEKSLERPSKGGSGNFPSISELMKRTSSSPSISGEEPVDEDKGERDNNRTNDGSED